MNYHKEHNIFPMVPKYFNYEIDSVYIHSNVTFQQISSVLNFPIEDLRFLNPMYIKDIIPGAFKPYPVYLPKKLIGDFLANEKNLKSVIEHTVSFKPSADSSFQTEGLPDPPVSPPLSVEKIHIVKKGEYVSSIARKYAVRVSDIMEWNRLKSSTLYVGQKIKVQVHGSTQVTVNPSNHITTVPDAQIDTKPSAKYKYYTVRSGDTLSEISRRYGVSVANLMKLNNLRSKSLKVGARLKIKLV
jgi:membrane-bound lytic murein transglycosylase D